MEREQIPFLMEVVSGHRGRPQGRPHRPARSDGQLVLRETAQTPPEDAESFRDYRRWRYYNTNSLWVDLHALDATLRGARGALELPVIVNRKTVDPRDPDSTPVVQLESAMGAAIGSFPGRGCCSFPRTRFVPSRRPTTCSAALRRLRARRGWSVAPVPERAGGCRSSSSTRATTS